MKGMAHSSPNRSITRQKQDDTLFFKHVASGSKAKWRQKAGVKLKTRFSSSASDGCSTSHMKPEKSAMLTQPDAQDSVRPQCTMRQQPDLGGAFQRY